MTQTFTPRAYQASIMDWALEHNRCAVWAGMGMGKTVATLTVLDTLSLVESGPALVLAPLRVAMSTWPDEARKWSHLRHVEISPIVGTPAERAAALKRDVGVYTINYDNLPWLIDQVGERWPFSTVVADESTRLKSFRLRQGGVRAQALGRVAHTKIKRFIELTGTPSPNGLEDLWGQAWFLDAGQRLGRTFGAFNSRWFQSLPGPAGYQQTRPLAHAQAEIEDKLRDLCISLNAADWFDIEQPVMNVIRVELPKKARAIYRDMEREMFASLGDGTELEVFSAAAKSIKCLQLANGAAYTDGDTWSEVHDVKLQAVEEIIAEAAGAPVLVAYHFKSDLARLQRAFPQGRHLDTNPQTVRDWNAGNIPVLFAHPASAGHGLNLADGGNILAFFGHWWNLEEYLQIIERIGPTRQTQAGHPRPVFVHHIIAADTVDELVMARRETKREVQDLLLDAMKARRVRA